MSEEVRKMFSEIAVKYDLMNDILSFGIHRLWRRKLVKILELDSNSNVLDLACGTGDLSFAMRQKAGKVLGTDFCEDMLIVARDKAKQKNSDIEFLKADATDLQFDDNQFTASTISFGIRNVDDVSKCLKEMARCVKPGSKVAILEFGQAVGILAPFYNFYSSYIMPIMGKIFAGAKSAYTYLPKTAAKFPCREEFLKIMNDTGCFCSTKYYTLNSGIAYIYIGIKK